MTAPTLAGAGLPTSTYRVQFHKGCTFAQVTQAVPYLHALGITHLYSAPYLRARTGSTHGYDIVDHAQLNPEIGDETAHADLCAALQRHGMGQILDVVPNHMGVLETDNAWWLDVLEHGQASAFADTFDIEWHAAEPTLTNRLLLPVLGDQYGRVLERGEIALQFDADSGAFALHYFEHRFPVDPGCVPRIFAALPMPAAQRDTPGDKPGDAPDDAVGETTRLLGAFARLPARDASDGVPLGTRARQSALLNAALGTLARQHGWLAAWIDGCLKVLNGDPADAGSFDALDALVGAQAYRLAHWRAASDEVNYRRFFDVNTLAALRMERDDVFEATHARVLGWLADHSATGLRIDHPDGLAQPQRYFERLQQSRAGGLYLLVEKILAEHEALPAAWPVHGDSGYRFAGQVNGLFVDSAREAEMDRLWQAFTGDTARFEEVVYRCKQLIIETSLFSELRWLAMAAHRILQSDRRTVDYSRHRVQRALAEIAASFPVYRTYVHASEPASAADQQHVDWAVAAARRRLGEPAFELLDTLRALLLNAPGATAVPAAEHERFLARWQQFTAPVMAKSVEDTAFYRHLRLASLNDVGCDPARYGVSVASFHAENQIRARFYPHTMLATSTHDSKRAEDLRARIDVLSEVPELWGETLQRLDGLAEMARSDTDAGRAPARRDIWLLFQTLAGLWPADAEAGDEGARHALRERLQAYMLKAVREAKEHTSWADPVPAYEEALARTIDAVLRPGEANPFVAELQRLTQRIAPFGFANSLAQAALKFTSPGVPDLYQGCEVWGFSLVDPDNRRPVDFARLEAQLDGLRALYDDGRWPTLPEWVALREQAADGRLKQLVTWRLLQLRKTLPLVFAEGGYQLQQARGGAAAHALAYARSAGGTMVLVVATRLLQTLCAGDPTRWGPALWQGTTLVLQGAAAQAVQWTDWLTGRVLEPQGCDTQLLALDQVFADRGALPFAVLVAGPLPPDGDESAPAAGRGPD